MIATLGSAALFAALVAVLLAAVSATVAGALQRPRIAARAAFALLIAAVLTVVATGALLRALAASDFAIRYVATYSAFQLPLAFKLGAIGVGDAGVLLLWTTGFLFAAARAAHRAVEEAPRQGPVLVLTVAAGGVFALAVLAIRLTPFSTLDPAPIDGIGLDPELQRFSILVATPLVLVGLGVAAATLVAAIVAGMRRPLSVRGRTLLSELNAWVVVLLAPGLLLGLFSASQVGDGSLRLWDARHLAALPVLVVSIGLLCLEGREDEPALSGLGRTVVLVSLGMLVVALIAVPLRTTADVALRDGETTRLRDRFGREWRFTSQGTSRFERPPNQWVMSLAVSPRLGNRRLPLLTAEQREYVDGRGEARFAPVMTTGTRGELLVTAQVAILEFGRGGAMVRVSLWPLRALLWVGGGVLLVGACLSVVAAMLRDRDDRARAQRALDGDAEAAIARWRSVPSD